METVNNIKLGLKNWKQLIKQKTGFKEMETVNNRKLGLKKWKQQRTENWV